MNRKSKRNIEAENSILNGFLGVVPASLVGGIPGALASIFMGLFSAKRKVDRQIKGKEYLRNLSTDICDDQYANLSRDELYEVFRDRFFDAEKIETGELLRKNRETYFPKNLLREYDRLKDADDFRVIHLVYGVYKDEHYIGFYATGKEYVCGATNLEGSFFISNLVAEWRLDNIKKGDR